MAYDGKISFAEILTSQYGHEVRKKLKELFV